MHEWTINQSYLNIHIICFLNDTNYILETLFYKVFIVKFIIVLAFSFLEIQTSWSVFYVVYIKLYII